MTAGEPVDVAGERRFGAFISYSHADEKMAARLHRWLEGYRIPSRLVGVETASGKVRRNLGPIFRDRNELPAATSLGSEVRKALAACDALLVLCSPEAAASRWVGAEIELFRQLHPDRPVIAALIRGEPSESFPRSLLVTDAVGIVHEPIAADFRSAQDGPKLARLKIVAGLTGLALDQIIQRDAQRQLRRVIAITFLVGILTLSLGLMLVFALQAQREADHQRRQAEGLIEFMLTDLRQKLKGVGRLDVLDTVNERAIGYYAEQSDLEELPVDSLERRARVLHAMGEDDHRRGNVAQALEEFGEASRVTRALLDARPDDPGRIFAHAQSEFWLGYVDFIRHNYDDALPRFTAYRDLAERLVEMEPDNKDYLRELAYAQGNICSIGVEEKKRAGKGAQGQLEECRNALATMERVARMEPDNASVIADLANRHAWLADALRLAGKDREALSERRIQSYLIRRLVREDPKNKAYMETLMLSHYSTAELLHALGQEKRARELLEQAREEVEELIATDPENHDWQTWRRTFETPFT